MPRALSAAFGTEQNSTNAHNNMNELSLDGSTTAAPEVLKICFLDYDGVTHVDAVFWSPDRGIHITTPGRALFEWAHILATLLEPYPDVKIVLSTSWVRLRGLEFAKAQLPPVLRARVIGATFDNRIVQKLEFDMMSRGCQVYAEVERRKPAKWFAIDNDDKGWPPACRDKLIKTDDNLGLSLPEVQDAISKMLASF